MITHSKTSPDIINKAVTQKVIIAATVGLLIVIIAWALEFSAQGIALSVSGIAKLHVSNPALWIIDILPILFGYITYLSLKKHQEKVSFLEDEISQRDQDINKNALFAKTIGEGNYNAPFQVSDEDDILGKSLLVMRDNLLENNKKEAEQSWITKGKDEVSYILRLHNNIGELSYEVLVKLISYINIIQGALYIYDEDKGLLTNLATYAYNRKKYINQEFKVGQGLIGQCAYERDIVYRTEIPEDYASITSGILGDKKPKSLLIVPLITDEKLQGVIEFASLDDNIPELTIRFLREMGEIIARTIFNLRINQKTEQLLHEAQQMTQELKENEEELRQNAEEMRATHEELEKSNVQLESKIQEVENAQKRIHSLLENASEIISIYSSSLKLTYISPSVTKILGYTPQEMMSGKDIDRLTRKGEQELNDMFQKLLDSPRIPITIQYTFMKKDGTKLFLEVTGSEKSTSFINGILGKI
ncbi:MAG: GAF domain-containing protein [Perlabentimonas sp.]